MIVFGDIRRILLLMIGIGGAICMAGILLQINQAAYVQYDPKEPLLYVQTSAGESEISFPFKVPGTNLVAEALVYYDGPLLENGSDMQLFNSVALLLRNTSEWGIRKAEIQVQWEDIWCFRASYIPPKATVLVVESSGAKFADTLVTACTGGQEVEIGVWEVDNLLRVDSIDMGTVSVTNTTGAELTNICLLYKNWLPQNKMYVGGITYEIQIDRISAGETIILKPNHYAKGYSRFIKIYADEI